MIKNLPFSILLVLFLFSVAFAQEKTIPAKFVVLFDKHAFYNEKSGVKKLVDAENIAINQGFTGEPDKQKRVESYQRAYEKRKKIMVEPIQNEILALLKQIGNQNNIIFLDGAELEENGQLLAFNHKLDFSRKVVQMINDYFAINLISNIKPDLPETSIAVFSSNLFDELYLKNNLDVPKKETKELGLADKLETKQKELSLKFRRKLQEFANENGFDLILDSSKKTPIELENFPIQDVTNDFISYFKQTNP